MRSTTLRWTFAALLILTAVSAPGQVARRFFVRADLGAALATDTKLTEFAGSAADARIKFDPGVRFGLAGGYHITDWISAGIETGYIFNSIRSITGARLDDASVTHVPILANLTLQWPTRLRLTPFVGGAVGGDVSVLDADYIDLDGQTIFGTGSTMVFAYQALGGLRYEISSHLSVGLAYRYYQSDRPSWDVEYVRGGGKDHIRFGRNETHSISALVSFTF